MLSLFKTVECFWVNLARDVPAAKRDIGIAYDCEGFLQRIGKNEHEPVAID